MIYEDIFYDRLIRLKSTWIWLASASAAQHSRGAYPKTWRIPPTEAARTLINPTAKLWGSCQYHRYFAMSNMFCEWARWSASAESVELHTCSVCWNDVSRLRRGCDSSYSWSICSGARSNIQPILENDVPIDDVSNGKEVTPTSEKHKCVPRTNHDAGLCSNWHTNIEIRRLAPSL